MRLQAILFGPDTLVDRRDLERHAFNRVFQEAGLPWNWDAGLYARLCQLADKGDILEAFISAHRPHWRNSQDLQHLLAAVRRRQAAVCKELAALPLSADKTMIGIAEAAGDMGLRLCAILPPGQAIPEDCSGMAVARDHEHALAALKVPAAACISIESTAEGFAAAADVGIVTFDRLALSANSGPSREMVAIALLEDVHARGRQTVRPSRLLSSALIA